jgi:hypothetical protein
VSAKLAETALLAVYEYELLMEYDAVSETLAETADDAVYE